MEDYPGNSRSAPKPDEKPERLEKVTTGEVRLQKPSLGKRIAAAFTGEDGRSVVQHVVWEVLIPAAKDMMYDAGREALGRSLGIDDRFGRRGNIYANTTVSSFGSSLASKVVYNRPGFMQSPQERQQPRQMATSTRGSVSVDDILLATRVEADEVINKMNQLIGRYGRVTIADVFDLVGVTGEYTDENFGWDNLAGARPNRVSNGYRLSLPMPIQLSR